MTEEWRVRAYVPELADVIQAIQQLKEQMMADFEELKQELLGAQSDLLAEVEQLQAILDKDADAQLKIDEAKGMVQALRQGIQQMVPDTPAEPETPGA